jgi:hypothetical protein
MSTPPINIARGWDASDEAFSSMQQGTKNSTFMFKLAPGTKEDIIFLDDLPYTVEYHDNLKANRNGRDFYPSTVCLGPDCPLCAAGYRASRVAFFTVMHLTHLPTVDSPDWENPDHWSLIPGATENRARDGRVFKNDIRLLGAKKIPYEAIKYQAQKRDGILHGRFEAIRPDDKQSSSVGTQFDFDKKYTLEQVLILNPNAAAIDYETAIPRMTLEEIRALLPTLVAPQGGRTAQAPAAQAPFAPSTTASAQTAEQPRRRAVGW